MRPAPPPPAKPLRHPTRSVPPIPASPDSTCRPRRPPPVPEVPMLPVLQEDSCYVRKKFSSQAGDGPYYQRPVQKIVSLFTTRLRNQHAAVTSRPMKNSSLQNVRRTWVPAHGIVRAKPSQFQGAPHEPRNSSPRLHQASQSAFCI